MNFENELNKNQLEAVETPSQHARVIAGAGSGKTRVLTYRIAYLIGEMNVRPWKILAITFTNKVANEMKNRVIKLIPEAEKDLTIKTFHSFSAYFLRHEISAIGFPSSFTILDEEDQDKMIKDIGSSLGYKRTDPLIKKAISYISSNKLKEKYPEDIKITNEFFEGEKTCLEIYTIYEENKNKMFCLDFDDLLLKTNYILANFPIIREKWQQKIDHILVDEFQDTNDVEYRLIKFLTKPSTCLYVVGDPDQTIYTWRGANQDIILHLEKDYPLMDTIILDRNYRSTQTILDSANKLISYNKMRVKKNLYTENNKGAPIVVRASPSATSEAEYVAREVNRLKDIEHYSYRDIVILYRSNYLTVDFENAFVAHHIPYNIYGGTKFYQRREIKDVLAYFRLIVNPKDDVAFERIINVPRRGIGETSVNFLKKEALVSGLSLYDYIYALDPENSEVSNKVINQLKIMITVLESTKSKVEEADEAFSKPLEDMLNSFGYYEYLLKEDDGDDRLENVKALFADLRRYLKNNPESTFDEYLQNIALISSQDEVVDGDFVTFMTVHTAKGLEYPVVFVVRFNDCVFPHVRSLNEEGYKGLEEERRLAYVAMTRAKKKLYLSCAAGYSFVINGQMSPSQFFKESGNPVSTESSVEYSPFRGRSTQPSHHFSDGENHSFTSQVPVQQNFDDLKNDVDMWHVGDICIHEKFGSGIVIEVQGDGVIKVNFKEHGLKILIGSHPKLKKGN